MVPSEVKPGIFNEHQGLDLLAPQGDINFQQLLRICLTKSGFETSANDREYSSALTPNACAA